MFITWPVPWTDVQVNCQNNITPPGKKNQDRFYFYPKINPEEVPIHSSRFAKHIFDDFHPFICYNTEKAAIKFPLSAGRLFNLIPVK